ncbi:hypothetical protein B0H67DRAFT_572935 [Lasiosphaeris hirsuta]|uniref:Uncharacterized protein n=1 Tax=Lasiosphaeris hirsuta TaxID=260670 RepID=A0AA40DXL1_9PEZI|nr:hypothetical protein B0H67DRAFT_572935 [Lasiosphaeris hirsuta]
MTRGLGRAIRYGYGYLFFFFLSLLLPGCPPDEIWVARHLRQPRSRSAYGFENPAQSILGFYMFHLLPTAILTGLFIQAIRTLPLGGPTQVFGTWYLPVIIFIATGAILLSLGCVAIQAALFVGLLKRRYGHPRLTRRLIVQTLGTAAVLQVLVGLAGIVLSYPEAWLRAEQDRQDWRRLSQRDANLKWLRAASWLVFVYGTIQLAGAVIPMASCLHFRPPVQYEPTVQDTNADDESVSCTETVGQREPDMAILAQHFSQQRRQARQPNVKKTLSESAPGANQNKITEQQRTTTPMMGFDPGIVYWTGIWKNRGSRYRTRLEIIALFLVASAFLIPLSGGMQITTFIITRRSSQECGWQCYWLITYPFLSLPLFLVVSYLVYMRIPLRSEPRGPREPCLRGLVIVLAILFVLSQVSGVVLSALDGVIAMSDSNSVPGRVCGGLFIYFSSILIIASCFVSLPIFLWHM